MKNLLRIGLTFFIALVAYSLTMVFLLPLMIYPHLYFRQPNWLSAWILAILCGPGMGLGYVLQAVCNIQYAHDWRYLLPLNGVGWVGLIELLRRLLKSRWHAQRQPAIPDEGRSQKI